MLSIDLIRDNLRRSEEIVLARIEDMRDHCMVLPTPRGGCHTLWILGHLAYIEASWPMHAVLRGWSGCGSEAGERGGCGGRKIRS